MIVGVQFSKFWKKLHLLSSSDDEDATKDEALSQNISHEAFPEGSQTTQPHPDAQEPEEPHLPLTRPIKPSLQTNRTEEVSHAVLNWFFTDTEWL